MGTTCGCPSDYKNDQYKNQSKNKQTKKPMVQQENKSQETPISSEKIQRPNKARIEQVYKLKEYENYMERNNDLCLNQPKQDELEDLEDLEEDEDIYENENGGQFHQEQISLQEYDKSPCSNIGAVYCYENQQADASTGTGIIVGYDLILTVAHNIFNKEKKKIFKNIKFMYKFYQTQKIDYNVIQYRVSNDYLAITSSKLNRINSTKSDYALLKLDRKIQNIKFDIKLMTHFYNVSQEISICGFTKTKNRQKKLKNRMQRFVGDKTNSIVKIYLQSKVIHYKLPTEPGQSGSPIYFTIENTVNNNQQVIVVALHKGKVNSKNQVKCNTGNLFNKFMIKDLRNWTRQLKSQIKCQIVDYMVSKTDFLFQPSLVLNVSKQMQLVNKKQHGKFPYNCVVRLLSQFQQSGLLQGTGFLISQNLVLTSYSCLYHPQMKSQNLTFGEFKKKLYIYILLSLDGKQEQIYQVERFVMHEEYYRGLQDQDYTSKSALRINKNQLLFLNYYDYCLLKLKRKAKTENNQYLPLLVRHNKIDLNGYKLIGYLADQIQINKKNKSQINKINVEILNQDHILKYFLNNQKGQKGILGSPILYDSKEQGFNVIGYHKCTNIIGQSFGRYVSQEMVQNLYKWRKQLDGSQFKVNIQLQTFVFQIKNQKDFMKLLDEQSPVKYF